MVPKIFVSEGDHCAWWQLLGQLCGSWRLLWKLPGGQLGQRSIGENPQTMGERPRNLANDHWKVGKVKFFLKPMGLLPSVLLFWKCWKDQWKEGSWPSKLVVKINQKCEVDHPKRTWNQKKCRLSSFWVPTIKHDQFTIKMWVVFCKNWEGMGVKTNDFPQLWTSIRTMWILPGYRRGLIHWIHWIWRCSYWKDNIRLTMVRKPRIGLAYKSTNHHVQHQNYFLGVYPIFRHQRIAVKQYVRFRSSQWWWRKAPQSPLTGVLIFLDTLV